MKACQRLRVAEQPALLLHVASASPSMYLLPWLSNKHVQAMDEINVAFRVFGSCSGVTLCHGSEQLTEHEDLVEGGAVQRVRLEQEAVRQAHCLVMLRLRHRAIHEGHVLEPLHDSAAGLLSRRPTDAVFVHVLEVVLKAQTGPIGCKSSELQTGKQWLACLSHLHALQKHTWPKQRRLQSRTSIGDRY